MSIKLLNNETIQLINNTQIISSIYSAVKELVENSLDAQAQNIEVNLVNNGLSLIEVKDNGSGICRGDAQYMALPSYTSKISNFHDLDFLSTYGFRGESLTAICQVADVTICTKTANDETMTCYVLDNEGHVVDSELTHGLTGTSVKIRNLFKNMPVRRNILNNKKRINQEIKAIEILLKIFAICKPSIRFMFRVNSNTILTKPSCKDIFEGLKSILGIQVFSKLTCIEKSFTQTEMQLFVPKKDIKDCSEISQIGLQFVCVNDRPIKFTKIEKQISRRVSEYFNPCTSICQKFIFCLILKVDSSMLDVNLEPNKDKVFLQNEIAILSEIDKSLLSFYELTDSELSIQNEYNTKSIQNQYNFEKIDSNTNSNEINKEKEEKEEEEEEWPVHKKRKIDETRMTYKDILNTKENNDKDMNKSENNFLKNIIGSILSVSDSNDVDELNKNIINKQTNKCHLLDTQQKYSKNNNSELFDFAQDILSEEQVIKESLSQLPQVDLGEDFNMKDIVNKNNKLSSSSTETFKVQQITNMTWNKEQISGLQSAIINGDKNVNNILNHKADYYKNQEAQLEDSDSFDFMQDMKQINDSKKLVSNDNISIVNDDKFDWKLIMKNFKQKTSTEKKNFKLNKNSLNAHVDPTQTKIAFTGDNKNLNNQPSSFALYCATVRTKIIKQYPEFTPAEVAIYMNKQWKQISTKEHKYYRNLINQQTQNTSNLFPFQLIRKTKSEHTQTEKNKNRKQFLSMLGNMKTNKVEEKTESMIMRTFISWNINVSLVDEKFKKPLKKIEKSIVGSLNSLLWIINLTSNLFVFDITELQAQLNIKYCDVTQIDAKYVEDLVDQWLLQKNDMSIFYAFHFF